MFWRIQNPLSILLQWLRRPKAIQRQIWKISLIVRYTKSPLEYRMRAWLLVFVTCSYVLSIWHSPAQPLLSGADFAAAQLDFVPLSLRDVKLQKSEVAWSDIGGMWWPTLPFSTENAKNFTGLHETRRVLRETLEWPTKYGPIFAQSSLRLRSGSVPSSNPSASLSYTPFQASFVWIPRLWENPAGICSCEGMWSQFH